MREREYFIIGVPARDSREKTWSRIKAAIGPLALLIQLRAPPLRFSGLDDIVCFTELAVKVEACLDSLLSKIVQSIAEFIPKEHLTNCLNVYGQPVDSFLCKFVWDHQRYSVRPRAIEALRAIDIRLEAINDGLKEALVNHSCLRRQVQTARAKQTCGLLARDPGHLVRKEDLVSGSKCLETLLLLVPQVDVKNWIKYNEYFWHGIVPGSSKLIFSDASYALFSVTVFSPTVEAFKKWIRKSRLILRPYIYDEAKIEKKLREEKLLETKLCESRKNLSHWLENHYSECFGMYVHLKLLLVIGESVFRYGPETTIIIAVMCPKKRQKQKVDRALVKTLTYLSDYWFPIPQPCECFYDIPGLTPRGQDLPYVSSPLSLTGEIRKCCEKIK